MYCFIFRARYLSALRAAGEQLFFHPQLLESDDVPITGEMKAFSWITTVDKHEGPSQLSCPVEVIKRAVMEAVIFLTCNEGYYLVGTIWSGSNKPELS